MKPETEVVTALPSLLCDLKGVLHWPYTLLGHTMQLSEDSNKTLYPAGVFRCSTRASQHWFPGNRIQELQLRLTLAKQDRLKIPNAASIQCSGK